MTLRIAACIALALAAGMAHAQGLKQVREISLVVAVEAINAAVAECRAQGHNIVVAIVDRAGYLVALHRADGVGPHALETARRKAYTAASFKRPTSFYAELLQKDPASRGLMAVPDAFFIAGGVPITAGNEVVGAIGVGGARGGHIEEACANAGIDKIKDRLL